MIPQIIKHVTLCTWINLCGTFLKVVIPLLMCANTSHGIAYSVQKHCSWKGKTLSLILKLVFFHTVGLYLKLNHVLVQGRISGSIFNMPQWDHPLPTLDSILSTLTCSWPRSAADKVQLRPRAILLLKLQLLKQWKVPFCSLKQHHQQHTSHFWARAIQLHCTKSPSGWDYFTNQFVPRIF